MPLIQAVRVPTTSARALRRPVSTRFTYGDGDLVLSSLTAQEPLPGIRTFPE